MVTMDKGIIEINVKSEIKSLHWDGDNLIDYVSGGRAYSLDSSVQESRRYFAYKFDACVVSLCDNWGHDKWGQSTLILNIL